MSQWLQFAHLTPVVRLVLLGVFAVLLVASSVDRFDQVEATQKLERAACANTNVVGDCGFGCGKSVAIAAGGHLVFCFCEFSCT